MAALSSVRSAPPLLTYVIKGQDTTGRHYKFTVDGTFRESPTACIFTGILTSSKEKMSRVVLKVAKASDLDRTFVTDAVWQKKIGRKEGRVLQKAAKIEQIVKLKAGFKCGSYLYAIALEQLSDNLEIATRDKPLTMQETSRCGKVILKALKSLHLNNLVYGDLKPENICLTDGRGYKLIDLEGVTKLDGSHTFPRRNTIDSWAPETFYDFSLRPSYDMYGLGYVLFFCATGDQLLEHDGVAPADPELMTDLVHNFIDLMGMPPEAYCNRSRFLQYFSKNAKGEWEPKIPRSQHMIQTTFETIASSLTNQAMKIKDPDLQKLEIKRAELLLDLLQKIFVYENRISVDGALKHAFFADIDKPQEKKGDSYVSGF